MHNFLCKETLSETEFGTCKLNGKCTRQIFLWTDRQMGGEPGRFQDTVLPPLTPSQGIITIILALSCSTTGFHKPVLLFQ